jgi:predicted RNA-binding Zn-ribbon protein involved in translation (DUF1610 family)
VAASATNSSDNENQKRNLKYALIHLCSGIELVFKERLRQDDWQLVFQDQDKATEGAYQSGDFKSVYFNTAQDRLEEECGVEFTPQQKKDLQVFRNRRNKVEHFNAVDTFLAMQSGIAQMVSFLVDFVEENFDVEEFEAQEHELLSEIRLNLGKCATVVQERLAIIEPEIDNLHSVVQCPSCLQKAMNADGGTVKCLFCHYSPKPLDAAEEYVTNVLGYPGRFTVEKDGGQWPIRTCPECGNDTFVTAIPARFDAYDFYCFNCGVEYGSTELELCHDCGEHYTHGGEAGSHICPRCFRARVSKDD